MTLHYENLVPFDTPEWRSLADDHVNEIKHVFLTNFGVNLVQRSPARYVPALANPWLTPSQVLDIEPSNHNTLRFRFVNIPSWFALAGAARQGSGMVGSTFWRMGDMVVTTWMFSHESRRFTVVHEISHLFNAPDCSVMGCVMNSQSPRSSYNNWCDPCRARMHEYLSFLWHEKPFLRDN